MKEKFKMLIIGSIVMTAALLLAFDNSSVIQAANKALIDHKTISIVEGRSKTVRIKKNTKRIKWSVVNGKKNILLKKRLIHQ